MSKTKGLGVFQKDMKQLGLIGAVEAVVPASQLKKLAGVSGLIVTPNADVKLSGVGTTQLWPYESGNALMWPGDTTTYAGKTPAIAIVDSGIQNRADFGGRVIASVNLSTIAGNTSLNDERGHGTFVAGIAAGASPDLTGAAPAAPLVSVKVMNDQGQAKTSDVITAAQWILDNKAKYNIGVANFSLHSSYSTNFYRDPLDQAVEKLWFGGVVVVAAAGNYGIVERPLGRALRSGQRPVRDHGRRSRHRQQPVGTRRHGRAVLGLRLHAGRLLQAGRRGSGPVHGRPDPGRLDDRGAEGVEPRRHRSDPALRHVVRGTDRRGHGGADAGPASGLDARSGEGRADADGTQGRRTATRRLQVSVRSRPAGRSRRPTRRTRTSGLERFVTSSGGSGNSFDAMSWANSAKSDMSWNSMSWNSQSWSDQSWSDQSWASMSWADMSWNSMSWTDMSWTDMSWADTSQEDAAEGDTVTGSAGYQVDAADIAEAATDPSTAVPVDGIDPLAALGVTADRAVARGARGPGRRRHRSPRSCP